MPITKFLFWNINRKPLAGLVADLAEIHRIDVVILAECDEPALMLRALNRAQAASFHFPDSRCERIRLFTRFPGEFLRRARETERISITRLMLPARKPVLLTAVHLPSKLHWSAESQARECVALAKNIEIEEREAGHTGWRFQYESF